MIWPDVIATGVVAALGGALAVPSTRRLLLGEVKHDWLQDELDLDHIAGDGATIVNKDGTHSRAWRLRGLSYDAKIEQEQHALLLGRQALLHQLGGKGLQLRFLAVKRRRPLHCTGEWPHPTLTEIGRAERVRYQSSYEVEWYLLVSGRWSHLLADADQAIQASLSAYKPAPVTVPEDPDSPCPLTGLLNGLVCGDYRRDLSPQTRTLSGALPACDLRFEPSGLVRTEGATPAVHRIIGIREWPETVSGRTIGDLLALDGDLEITQICDPWNRDKALAMYKRQEQAQRTALLGNHALASETGVVLDMLSDGTATLFVAQFQVIARAENETALASLVKQVCEVLGERRISYSVETTGTPLCWFARLPTAPGKGKLIPGGHLLRPLVIRDQNIAALWAFHHAPRGQEVGPFGDRPVRYFMTPSGGAYAFQFHVSPKPQSLGHFLVFAPSGGGKSTLLMHLLGGLAKFEKIRSYIFDSKEGTRFMVEAMGGAYQSYDQLALNPLDVGEDTAANRNRIYAILRSLCGGLELASEDKDALNHAVDIAMHLEPPHRTLNEIYNHAFARRSDLRRHFSQWVVDDKGNRGMHSHVFNAPQDSLAGVLNHYMVAINMNEALDDPELGPPVVAHIASAIGKTAARNSRGFVIFIDEAAKLLQNAGFLDLAVEMFREYRKLNGVVGMAFQDPAALFKTGRADAFVESCATLIFLPNANAKAETFAPFGLNDEQLAFCLGQRVTAGRRQALVVKRDGATGFDESAILDIDLSFLGPALRFYRSGVDANSDLDRLKQTWREQWHGHL
ncbi:VirB4 family type IV secretion system protein [Rhodospirillum sp. A1_3_36]|uniref:VirB4 family type IV secretion system protein n=1 Tax=Rhodospirillum sp. A1_3_36 TaxID=3391666 RepID=UPI0039A62554